MSEFSGGSETSDGKVGRTKEGQEQSVQAQSPPQDTLMRHGRHVYTTIGAAEKDNRTRQITQRVAGAMQGPPATEGFEDVVDSVQSEND